MRLTTKGQVTIPQHIRHSLGLQPHMDIDFVMENGRAYLRKSKAASSRGTNLVRSIRGRAQGGLSTDEIMALTRDE